MFFELDDIKRRHSNYYDIYNVGGWVTAPDSTLRWNYLRGLMVGLTASFFNEFVGTFTDSWRLLLKNFEPPNTFKQVGIFARETMKLENFKLALRTRSQYALTIGATDIAARVALFRYINSGWQRPFAGFEYAFQRKIPGTILISLLTAPIGIPLEMARMAYYADKTFPEELQKGYKSYFNALRRIPFEEGPYYLFKNTSPLFLKNFFQTFTLFYTYDFLKDKCSWLWRIMDTPYLPSKIFLASFSTYMACLFSYPWAVVVREAVDFWPQTKNGVSRFNGNYRKAGVWLWYHDFGNNMFPGFFNNYFWKQAPWMMTTLLLADSLGIFSYWVVDQFSGAGTNSWEDIIS